MSGSEKVCGRPPRTLSFTTVFPTVCSAYTCRSPRFGDTLLCPPCPRCPLPSIFVSPFSAPVCSCHSLVHASLLVISFPLHLLFRGVLNGASGSPEAFPVLHLFLTVLVVSAYFVNLLPLFCIHLFSTCPRIELVYVYNFDELDVLKQV